jgi:hypothetical protein
MIQSKNDLEDSEDCRRRELSCLPVSTTYITSPQKDGVCLDLREGRESVGGDSATFTAKNAVQGEPARGRKVVPHETLGRLFSKETEIRVIGPPIVSKNFKDERKIRLTPVVCRKQSREKQAWWWNPAGRTSPRDKTELRPHPSMKYKPSEY